MQRELSYIIEKSYNGINIKTYLSKYLNMSSALIKRLKDTEGGILVNGEHRRVNYILSDGDELKITMRESCSYSIEPVNLNFGLIYEDEDIMIINKPPHMPTHPSAGNRSNTLANALMYYFSQNGEEYVFRAVNRLDKDTSGLMCIAKNSYAHSILIDEINSHTLRREYTAIVFGEIHCSGTINAPIGRSTESIIKREVRPDGQKAVTHYNVIKTLDGYTLLKLILETGRTHQIRVHMAHIGHPLCGDWLYGTEDDNIGRYLLHSDTIELIHPISGQKLKFHEDISEDMQKFVENIIEKD